MLANPTDFLHSLARWAAARGPSRSPAATVVYAPATDLPSNLWMFQADEDQSEDPYGVLRPYPGSQQTFNPRMERSVQLSVWGSGNAAAMALAMTLYQALTLDDAGQPLRMTQIAGVIPNADPTVADTADGHWMLESASAQLPGQIDRDKESGWVKIVSNMNFTFFKLPT